ncbi:MAG: hypothetical protein IPJ19_07170 [Planctomycetes bacterium]|nr:hypothetical protein [Planctomycetota bacterium]
MPISLGVEVRVEPVRGILDAGLRLDDGEALAFEHVERRRIARRARIDDDSLREQRQALVDLVLHLHAQAERVGEGQGEAQAARRPGPIRARPRALPREALGDRSGLDRDQWQRFGIDRERRDVGGTQECAVRLAEQASDPNDATVEVQHGLGLDRAHEGLPARELIDRGGRDAEVQRIVRVGDEREHAPRDAVGEHELALVGAAVDAAGDLRGLDQPIARKMRRGLVGENGHFFESARERERQQERGEGEHRQRG